MVASLLHQPCNVGGAYKLLSPWQTLDAARRGRNLFFQQVRTFQPVQGEKPRNIKNLRFSRGRVNFSGTPQKYE